jgi:hypothetical protein
MVTLLLAFESHHLFGSGDKSQGLPLSRLLKEEVEMNAYHGRTQQFIQLKIPFRIWALMALAMGIFFALLIVLASIDI